jgi:transposase
MVTVEIRGAEQLSFRERQVVALKEAGFSNEAIAARLSLSSGSVNTLLHRARSKGYKVVLILDGDPLKLFEPGKGEEDESED